MLGFTIGCALAMLVIPWAMHGPRTTRPLGTLGDATGATAATPQPSRSWWIWLPPLALLIAGLVIAMWPHTSDCHGSPVCALDGFAVLGQWIAGGAVGLVGLVWLAIAGLSSPRR